MSVSKRKGLLHSAPPLVLSHKEFGELLQNRSFVDFFNVFLSLPIFPQRVLYKFDDRDFELDPPISRKKQTLDRSALVLWLLQERVPYFYRSSLYIDYQLMKLLLQITPHLTHSSHRLDYDIHQRTADSLLLWEAIGNVAGMCKFHAYLAGTPGQTVLGFWRDAQQLKNIHLTAGDSSSKDDLALQCHLMREIQIKYFGKKGKLVQLKKNEMWNVLKDGATILKQSEMLLNESRQKSHDCEIALEELQEREQEVFSQLQEAILALLQDYWLQKFLLHFKSLKSKQVVIKDGIKIRSQTDLDSLKYIEDIEQALALAQGSLFPNPQSRNARGAIAWNSMFPHVIVDDSFLKGEDDVVTLLDGEKVVVNSVVPEELDQMLQNYFESSSSDSDTSSPSITPIETKISGEHITPRNTPDESLQELLLRIETASEDAFQSRLTQRNLEAFEAGMEVHPLDVPGIKNDFGRPHSSPQKLPVKKIKRKKPLSKPEKKVAGNRNKTDAKILPPIDQTLKYTDSAIITLGPPHPGVQLSEPVYHYTNLCTGNFRYDNRVLVAAVATDCIAGKPFERFLRCHSNNCCVRWLHFWHNAQEYLSTKSPNGCDHLRFRRAKVLITDHLVGGGANEIKLFPGLSTRLRHHLSLGTGDELVRQVQDYAVQALQRPWSVYVKLDKNEFSASVVPRETRSRSFSRSSRMEYFAKENPHSPVKLPPITKQTSSSTASVSVRLPETRGLSIPADDGGKDEQALLAGLSEQRTWLALQMTFHLCHLDVEGLLLPPIQLSEIVYSKDSSEGSLTLKKLKVIRRRDLEEYKQRYEQAKRRNKASLDAEINIGQDKSAQKCSSEEDDTAPYVRPFLKDGVWIKRPPKPRSFSDLLKSALHVEFFRRFLAHNSAEGALMFYLSVEDLKKTKDGKARQRKISQILRKYFYSSKGYTSLDCNSEVIQEIPRMEKVPANLLVSAQSCVQRSIENKWFAAYVGTFSDQDDAMGEDDSTDENRKKYGKDKTRSLWISFVKSVSQFRRGLLDHELSSQFAEFLRQEAAREIEKQRASGIGGFLPGLPVKKLIKNKLVDVTKLVADMAFLAETDRYRSLCDNAASAASSGAYRIEDQVLLEHKAKTIVECFIESELPPKLQINISSDTSTIIVQQFDQGLVERRLFHDANMAIYPVMGYMWKKFQKVRFTMALFNPDAVIKRRIPVVRPATPDYLNLNLETCKKVISRHEDDHPHIQFSMAHGLKLIIPLPRDHVRPSSSSSQNSRDNVSSSLLLRSRHGSRAGSMAGMSQSIKNLQRNSIAPGEILGMRNRQDSQAGSTTGIAEAFDSRRNSSLKTAHIVDPSVMEIPTAQAPGSKLRQRRGTVISL